LNFRLLYPFKKRGKRYVPSRSIFQCNVMLYFRFKNVAYFVKIKSHGKMIAKG